MLIQYEHDAPQGMLPWTLLSWTESLCSLWTHHQAAAAAAAAIPIDIVVNRCGQ